MAKLTTYNEFGAHYRKHIILGKKRSRLEDWWIDDEGSIGHDCNFKINQGMEPLFFGKTFNGWNPIVGRFLRTCTNCGEEAPKELEIHSKLRRLR